MVINNDEWEHLQAISMPLTVPHWHQRARSGAPCMSEGRVSGVHMWVKKSSKTNFSKIVPGSLGVQKQVVLGCFELFLTHSIGPCNFPKSLEKGCSGTEIGTKRGQILSWDRSLRVLIKLL